MQPRCSWLASSGSGRQCSRHHTILRVVKGLGLRGREWSFLTPYNGHQMENRMEATMRGHCIGQQESGAFSDDGVLCTRPRPLEPRKSRILPPRKATFTCSAPLNQYYYTPSGPKASRRTTSRVPLRSWATPTCAPARSRRDQAGTCR